MVRPNHIQVGNNPGGEQIPILYEDRSVMAVDKPPGWMLAPVTWRETSRNLQAAVESTIRAGDFWARSRNLKYLRFVHRLDMETSGVLLLAKSPGALRTFSRLFESREVEKVYLAVVKGVPQQKEWTCHLKLVPVSSRRGKMKVDWRHGKEAETRFRVLKTQADSNAGQLTLVEARPLTGRTHQIRVHLAEGGHPVVGDPLYGGSRHSPVSTDLAGKGLALRAVALSYLDPFNKKPVHIEAASADFIGQYGFR